jgi:hypothetical protein
MSKIDKEIKKDYKEFWKDIFGFFGLLNFKQVKKELYDFHIILENVPKVYSYITDGTLSKSHYSASTVISEFERVKNKNSFDLCEIDDILDTDFESVKEFKKYIKKLVKEKEDE